MKHTMETALKFGLVLLSLLILIQHASCQVEGDIQLYKGSMDGTASAAGIVQLYQNSSWLVLCNHGFTERFAERVCRQLGFERGYSLPSGAYGKMDISLESQYKGSIISCPDDIATPDMADCEYEDAPCTEIAYEYASVSCKSGPIDTSVSDGAIHLEFGRTSPEVGYLSPLYRYASETWGVLCAEFWTDVSAAVACTELGYAGGVVAMLDYAGEYPYLGDVTCTGNDTSFGDCKLSQFYCTSHMVAGVFCYQTNAPSFSLMGGGDLYGKLVLNVDELSGLICDPDDTFDTNAANIACTQMGFTGGYVIQSNYDTGGLTALLENVVCDPDITGSLWRCKNNGWRNISSQCSNLDNTVSVYCYPSVHLLGGDTEPGPVLMGRVLIHDGDQWYPVCADAFNQQSAEIICRRLGFSVAEILLPGSFGNSNSRTEHITNITCAGTEVNIGDCLLSTGRCDTHRYDAALLCSQENTDDSYSFTLATDYYGEVMVTRHGMSGHVCREGWDDVDASVLCKETGYHSGIVLGTFKQYSRYLPVWASKFDCVGTETNLTDCAYETGMATDWACAADLVPAGALCYVSQPPDVLVRLNDGRTDVHGRVEVFNDRTGWGTVCNTGWSNADARVFCRQLGFADGQTNTAAYQGTAEHLPVVLSGLSCDGTETSLFQCPNYGWNQVSTSCSTHAKDAGVFCYKYVRLDPGSQYGAVQYHTGEKYGLVCADGFTERAAVVVCRQFGFNYAQTLCCSAMGPSNLEISLSDVSCSGHEKELRDCQYNDEKPTCASGNYATVYCAHYWADYREMTADPIVQVNYYFQDGYVCTEGFTTHDATTVCREKNFLYGTPFKASALGLENKIRWLRGLNCSAQDTVVKNCGLSNWGNIGICSWAAVAAVLCSNDTEGSKFDVRLVNKTGEMSGRVELRINNQWGSLCGLDLSRNEARVLCRQLGFHDGKSLAPGLFGNGNGSVLLTGLKCDGTESSFGQCIFSGYGQSGSTLCDHTKDAALECSYNVRLTGSTTVNYGRLEFLDIATDNWLPVCDYNFNILITEPICRQLGYTTGLAQEGSALGPIGVAADAYIVDVDCSNGAECTFSKGTCQSGLYLTLYCSEIPVANENVHLRLPLDSYYGPVSIRRYGLWGHICDANLGVKEAQAICKELSFQNGAAVQTKRTPGFPIIQGRVSCTDSADFSACQREYFSRDLQCNHTADMVAGVICYNSKLSFGQGTQDIQKGSMTSQVYVQVDDHTLYVSGLDWREKSASMYCRSLGLPGGDVYSAGVGSYGIGDVKCSGDEASLLECPGVWDPEKTNGKSGSLAAVECYLPVTLKGGKPTYYGAVFVSDGGKPGPVCAEGFNTADAAVVCKSFNYTHGDVLCCSPFGTLQENPVLSSPQCTGNEEVFTQCQFSAPTPHQLEECKKQYAAVFCHNGEPKETFISLPGVDSYSGPVIVTRAGIAGSICADNWDDLDARVACRQLGFTKGIANKYHTDRSTVGPYWASSVECSGTEQKLTDCSGFNSPVSSCTDITKQAAVNCLINSDMVYRLAGGALGESDRYGRVEVLVSDTGSFHSVCNTYWDDVSAHVFCKMQGFSTGETYHGAYHDPASGFVMSTTFSCDGMESDLDDCVTTTWTIATTQACARHEKDAGVFCYKSVKLSTGVVQERGAVLLYRDDTWNLVCADNFTDVSAAAVCRDLGFQDGQAQCCGGYGDLWNPGTNLYKIECTGNEDEVSKCNVKPGCPDNKYAAVVCYKFPLKHPKSTSSPGTAEQKAFDVVPIVVAVVVFICLVIIALVVFVTVRRYRRLKKQEASKQDFDSTIVTCDNDGSFAITNRLSGLVGTPEVPRVNYSNKGGKEHANIASGVSNPVYIRHTDTAASVDLHLDDTRSETGPDANNRESKASHPYNTIIDVNRSNTSKSHPYDSLNVGHQGAGNLAPGASNDTNTYDNTPGPQRTNVPASPASTSPYLSMSGAGDNVEYDNTNAVKLKMKSTDSSNGKAESHFADNESFIEDDQKYMTMLADKPDISSPTESVREPKWPSSQD